ncbi:MAG: hypothetical protein V4718_07335 [Pseudomonadota bacterium]
MPYGIRARAKRSNPFVRAQTTCWLQSEELDADGHIQVIGLSSGRRMVSFSIPVAAMERFEAIHFSADSHARLGFPTLDEAREFASELGGGATSSSFRPAGDDAVTVTSPASAGSHASP